MQEWKDTWGTNLVPRWGSSRHFWRCLKCSFEIFDVYLKFLKGSKFLIEPYWLSPFETVPVFQRVLPKCRPKGTSNGISSIFFLFYRIITFVTTDSVWGLLRSLTFVSLRTIISFTFPRWTSAKQNILSSSEEQENRLLLKCAFGTECRRDHILLYRSRADVCNVFIAFIYQALKQCVYLQITDLCSCLSVVLNLNSLSCCPLTER